MEATEETEQKGYHQKEYEKYHEKILECIDGFEKSGTDYTSSLIAERTGISIPCVNKHLKELRKHSSYKADTDLLAIKAKKIKKMIYTKAEEGDADYCRMVMAMEGWKKNKKTGSKSIFNNRGNIINVNGVRVTNKLLRKLPKEKLAQIEDIIKSIPLFNTDATNEQD